MSTTTQEITAGTKIRINESVAFDQNSKADRDGIPPLAGREGEVESIVNGIAEVKLTDGLETLPEWIGGTVPLFTSEFEVIS